MKNKKGFAWIKTILFIILCVLFCILVIFIMNYLKQANKKQNYTKINLQLNDTTPQPYKPLSDISSYYIFAYKNSNFQNNSSYYTNALNYETNSNVYVWDEGQANYYQYSSLPSPWAFTTSKNNTSLLVGNDLNVAHENVVREGTYFNGTSGVKSFAISYNCDINIQYFNFTMYYNFPTSTSFNIYFYVMTDVGSVRFTDFNFTATTRSHNFIGSSILSSLPTANRVLRFGFGLAQNSNANNTSSYLPNSNGTSSNTNGINYIGNVYNTYYNSLNQTAKDELCYITFDTYTYSNDYLNGYDNGYNDAINSQNSVITDLTRQVTDLSNNIDGLNNVITQQQNIIQNLQLQLDQSNQNFKGFFFTVADIPFRTIGNVLGFEVFGVNLFQFFIGVITALGMIWLIKKFV